MAKKWPKNSRKTTEKKGGINQIKRPFLDYTAQFARKIVGKLQFACDETKQKWRF
jgi:hypothetical protein